jgi:hypothetical protein
MWTAIPTDASPSGMTCAGRIHSSSSTPAAMGSAVRQAHIRRGLPEPVVELDTGMENEPGDGQGERSAAPPTGALVDRGVERGGGHQVEDRCQNQGVIVGHFLPLAALF